MKITASLTTTQLLVHQCQRAEKGMFLRESRTGLAVVQHIYAASNPLQHSPSGQLHVVISLTG